MEQLIYEILARVDGSVEEDKAVIEAHDDEYYSLFWQNDKNYLRISSVKKKHFVHDLFVFGVNIKDIEFKKVTRPTLRNVFFDKRIKLGNTYPSQDGFNMNFKIVNINYENSVIAGQVYE